MDAEGTSGEPVDASWEEPPMSEVIPEDEDRGGDGAIGDDETEEADE